MAIRSCGTGQGRPVPDLLGPDGQPLAAATVGGRTVYIENHGNGHQPADPAPAPPAQAPVWERRDPPADRYVHHDPVGRVQAQAAEEPIATGVVEGGAVRLPFGRPEDARTFRLAPDLNTLPFLRFATAANDGGRTEDLEGLAALYDMIKQVVDEDEWPAFYAYASKVRADDEELMEFVSQAVEVLSARPRSRRGNSLAGSPTTSPRSREVSSSPATPPPVNVDPDNDLIDVRELLR
jgi:hypothetical protein